MPTRIRGSGLALVLLVLGCGGGTSGVPDSGDAPGDQPEAGDGEDGEGGGDADADSDADADADGGDADADGDADAAADADADVPPDVRPDTTTDTAGDGGGGGDDGGCSCSVADRGTSGAFLSLLFVLGLAWIARRRNS